MADQDSIRQRIVSSVFSRRNAQGIEEQYAGHIKIWEDASAEEGGRKPRYILISQASNGSGFIHKSKLNANGSFSVGKSWSLQDLRGVEVIGPTLFSITLARTYRWQTENPHDQTEFLIALVRTFRTITRGSVPLQIAGMRDPDAPSTSRPPPIDPSAGFRRMERAPTPPNGAPLQPAPRRPHVNGYGDNSSEVNRTSHLSVRSASPAPASTPLTPVRPGSRPRRPDSPETTRPTPAAAMTERAATPTRTRPTTPSNQSQPPPSSLRSRQGRRPSNASSTARSSAATSSSQIPSIVAPSSPSFRPSVASSVTSSASTAPAPAAPSSYGFKMNGTMTSLQIPSAPPNSSSQLTVSPISAYPSHSPETPRARHVSPAPSRRPSYYDRAESSGQPRREQNARVSFYDPANQATLDRLLSGDIMLQLENEGGEEGGEVETESAQATLTSVEEMLEGYEWASDDTWGGKTRGTTDQIEARLLDELMALEKANIHSFIESDDRVNFVLEYLDKAIGELTEMDRTVQSYKIHLNAVSDDIAFIQGQRRGLQVQTQNERALLSELESLLQTVQVDREALLTLTQASLEKQDGIPRLEDAASQLYKALLAGKDRDMAATIERLEEYQTYHAQFCKRVNDYMTVMFTYQSQMLLGDNNGVAIGSRGRPSLKSHKDFENYVGRYGGLMLYLKEMDEPTYAKVCAAYFSAASALHNTQMKTFFAACSGLVKKGSEDDDNFGLTSPVTSTQKAAAGMRRAGTIVRSPLEARRERKDKDVGDMTAADAFALILEQIAPLIYREDDFIADFLQINDAALTFADYMGLENYFRRQAARFAGLSQNTSKLIRSAMDLIFGFVPLEIKAWLDNALGKDTLQIVGIIVCLERFLTEAEERGNAFFTNVLEKQHSRLKTIFDRRVSEQISTIKETKLTSKKRGGVAPFIKYFPNYISRVETQLIGADTLEIRQYVDQSYDKIVQAMFDALKQMAKMEGEGEDKGQLNYHVIMIENMHHFVAEMSQLELGSVQVFLKRAETIYDENLNAYVKIVLRRPFAKIIDYFEGVERLLKTTAPTEVASNSSYSKSALKKVVREYTAKDIRKHVDALFKRVEKHFTEASEKATTEEVNASTGIAPGTVMVGVWKACEEELLRITELFSKRINQCYQSAGITLEYTPADVEAAFKRHRVAS
ncbi:hypothetical protein K474DRAFT_1617469 [Panus rudis PR-1116 ss-1]|nr:hypothetical protein K474DRAFT_1617469 [Panus rudis PR-1116 ss-1]